jgi:hypothetical protein
LVLVLDTGVVEEDEVVEVVVSDVVLVCEDVVEDEVVVLELEVVEDEEVVLDRVVDT